jgi:hypothetical protein
MGRIPRWMRELRRSITGHGQLRRFPHQVLDLAEVPKGAGELVAATVNASPSCCAVSGARAPVVAASGLVP